MHFKALRVVDEHQVGLTPAVHPIPTSKDAPPHGTPRLVHPIHTRKAARHLPGTLRREHPTHMLQAGVVRQHGAPTREHPTLMQVAAAAAVPVQHGVAQLLEGLYLQQVAGEVRLQGVILHGGPVLMKGGRLLVKVGTVRQLRG